MLRRLNELFCNEDSASPDGHLRGAIDFRGLLAEAVESQGTPFRACLALVLSLQRITRPAFTSAELPTQQWTLTSRFSSSNSRYMRSLLTFSWRWVEPDYRSDTSQSESSQANVPEQASVPEVAEAVFHWRYANSNFETPTGPFLEEFDPFSAAHREPQLPTDCSRFQRLEDLLEHSEPHRLSQQDSSAKWARREVENLRFNDLYGPFHKDSQHITEALIEILDPQSKAAATLLAHAFPNGNAALVVRLLQHGVPITLEHFTIALKVCHRLATAFLSEYIQKGAPFKTAFDSGEEPDEQLLSQKQPVSGHILTRVLRPNHHHVCKSTAILTLFAFLPRNSQEEQQTCETIRIEGGADVCVNVDVDCAGKLRLVIESQKGSGSVSELTGVTENAASSSLGHLASQANEGSSTSQAQQSNSSRPTRNSAARVRYTELDPDTPSVELWRSHLAVLCYHEDRKHAALEACKKSADPIRRTDAHKALISILHEVEKTAKEALRTSKSKRSSSGNAQRGAKRAKTGNPREAAGSKKQKPTPSSAGKGKSRSKAVAPEDGEEEDEWDYGDTVSE